MIWKRIIINSPDNTHLLLNQSILLCNQLNSINYISYTLNLFLHESFFESIRNKRDKKFFYEKFLEQYLLNDILINPLKKLNQYSPLRPLALYGRCVWTQRDRQRVLTGADLGFRNSWKIYLGAISDSYFSDSPSFFIFTALLLI